MVMRKCCKVEEENGERVDFVMNMNTLLGGMVLGACKEEEEV